jgi:hypothetical protein
VFLAGPVGGYAALRFEETLGALRAAWWRTYLRAAHGRIVSRLRARRLALGREVEAALGAG